MFHDMFVHYRSPDLDGYKAYIDPDLHLDRFGLHN